MEVWIIRTVYEKFDYKYCELRQNIINHLIFNNYSGKGILTRKTYPIHLLEQVDANGNIKKEGKMINQNDWKDYFTAQNITNPKPVGTIIYNQDLAKTMKAISKNNGVSYFYSVIGKKIISSVL